MDQFRLKITDESTALALVFTSLSEWNNCCDRLKHAALLNNEDAIEGIFTVKKKGGLWDVNILGSAMKNVLNKI